MEELAIFELQTRPASALIQAEEIEINKMARELLEKLRVLLREVNWTAGQQKRAAVLSDIRVKLNDLPKAP